jgi:hypothetical protein
LALWKQEQQRVTAREQKFSSVGPLQHILSFAGVGEWAYVAPISRMARAAYMGAMFNTYHGLDNICRTGVMTATTSTARFDVALASVAGTQAMADASQSAGEHDYAYTWPVIAKLRDFGMRDGYLMLLAARTDDLLHLQSAKRLLEGAELESNAWQIAALSAVGHGAGAAALVWRSQQQAEWPVWYVVHQLPLSEAAASAMFKCVDRMSSSLRRLCSHAGVLRY